MCQNDFVFVDGGTLPLLIHSVLQQPTVKSLVFNLQAVFDTHHKHLVFVWEKMMICRIWRVKGWYRVLHLRTTIMYHNRFILLSWFEFEIFLFSSFVFVINLPRTLRLKTTTIFICIIRYGTIQISLTWKWWTFLSD